MSSAAIQVTGWLKEFSLRQGRQFFLNDKNECYLRSENNCQLTITAPEGEEVYISSVLGMVEDNPTGERIIKGALIKNLYQNQTLGGSLALDPSIDALIWCISRSVTKLDYVEFENMITNIFELSEALKEEFFSPLGAHYLPDTNAGLTGYLQV